MTALNAIKPVGGFFEAEILAERQGEWHPHALRISLGRAAFRLVLQSLRPARVRIPFYTCHVIWDTLNELKIPYAFYSLDDRLTAAESFDLGDDEYLLIINYFGLKAKVINELAARWGRRVIIDNTQAFFERELSGCYSFNSCRKFFGVPDGSYLYAPQPIVGLMHENDAISTTHLSERAAGRLEAGYSAFVDYEKVLRSEVRLMSSYSRNVLGRINYSEITARRRENFNFYHEQLSARNGFIAELDEVSTPFCYPFLPEREINRQHLAKQGIFVPTFWSEVISSKVSGFASERDFARRILPLPLDHRYGHEEITRVINALS